MKNYYIKNVKIPIYKQNFTIVFYKDKESFKHFLKIEKINNFDFGDFDDFDAFVFESKSTDFICFKIKENFDIVEFAGIVSHECNHLVNTICKNIQHTPSIHHDEPECYLIQFLVEEVFKYTKEIKIYKNLK